MTDETAVDPKSETKTDPKIVKLVAKLLYKMDSKDSKGAAGDKEPEAENDEANDAGFAAVRKEYQQKARNLLRRLEKKGVTFSV